MNSESTSKILPGSTIGILGSGQLGRMLSIAAKQMGYRVQVFSPESSSPAGQVSDFELAADYTDEESVIGFAKSVDVVTLEFENIPTNTLEIADKFAPVRPGAQLLRNSQNRIAEKSFLRDSGIPVGDFRPIENLEQLTDGLNCFGTGLLKTATDGYDGKGQVWIPENTSPAAIWENFGKRQAILESIIEFELEFSVIGARNVEGDFVAFAPILNRHQNQILDISISPAGLPNQVESQATEMVAAIMEKSTRSV